MSLNRDNSFPPSHQLWKSNKFGAVSTNNSSFDGGYANICVCWEKNEGDYAETCQSEMIRGGKSTDILEFCKVQF